jgi:sec-independent protein translocase protein TatA
MIRREKNSMFGPLGFPELIFILVLALLIFGPKRLPEIGRTIGRGMAEFRKASNELKRTINTELALEEQPSKPLAAWLEQPNYPAPAKAPETPANTTPRSPHSSLEAPAEELPLSEAALEPDDVPVAEAEVTAVSSDEPVEPR